MFRGRDSARATNRCCYRKPLQELAFFRLPSIENPLISEFAHRNILLAHINIFRETTNLEIVCLSTDNEKLYEEKTFHNWLTSKR